MLVSIQIPTYNQDKFLEKAVSTALEQDYQELEVVVCDDAGPSSEAASFLNIRDERLKIYRNEINLGRVRNYRHLLYHLVKGDWVVNLDGDDHLTDPHFISRAVTLLQSNPDAVLYMANMKHLDKICRQCRSASFLDQHHVLIEGFEFLSAYTKFPGFSHLSCLYNRKKAMSADFYSNESLNTDFVSMMKLSVHGKFILSSHVVGKWNLNENNESNQVIKEQVFKGNIQALENLAKYIKTERPEVDTDTICQNLCDLEQFYQFQHIVIFSTFPAAIKALVLGLKMKKYKLALLISFFIKRFYYKIVGR